MAVDPDSLTMPPRPMSWPPGVIRVARVITRAVSIIRPIANRDRDRARITSVIRPTIVRSVIARVTSIIPFTACRAEHGET
jgi:hypothetical protein